MRAFQHWLPLAVFVLVPSALIIPVLLSGGMLYGADVVSVFHFSRIVIAESFRSGRLPIWDSTTMAGFPLLAGVQGAVFYPPTWLCVLMSAGKFWTFSAWAHLILAGVFAHWWLERGLGLNPWAALAGALVYMMSGYICGHIQAGHVNYVWAYPWIPALLWRLERFLAAPGVKRGVLLAGVVSMLVLAGVPQFVFFTGLLVLARLSHFILAQLDGRKARAFPAGKSLAWLGLGLLFCAPQLLPTLELVGQMQRGHGESVAISTKDALEPGSLGGLLVESWITRNINNDWWEACGFVGGAALLLAVAAFLGRHPQRHLWMGIGVVGVILALGGTVPFYHGFVMVVPGASWFREPGRYLLFFTIAIAALAGMGAQALASRGRITFRISSVILGLASAAQLIHFAVPCFDKESEQLGFPPNVIAEARMRLGLEGRVAPSFMRVMDIGKCQAAGLDTIGGYEPMMLRRFAEGINAARGVEPDRQMVILTGVGESPVVQMLAARFWLRSSTDIWEFSGSMPRVWVVNNAVVLESTKERLRTIARGPWDPRRTVILETYPNEAPPVPTEAPAGRARVLVKKPGYYEIEAENDADAYLVLSEAYYPGWEADVDGRAVEVLPANHLIQTIRLSAGKHRVRFQYHSRFLGLGFAVAALAALVPVGLLVHRHRRQLALQRLPGAP
jgi:hypothetical protein